MDIINKIEESRKSIESGREEIKNMISRNEQKIEEIRKGEKKVVKVLDVKKLVLAGAFLAGVSFIAGRKEGLEISKTIHEKEGYNKAVKDIIGKLGRR